jgi:DNA sulfur modification protein DndE
MTLSTSKFRTSQPGEEALRLLHKRTNMSFNLLCRLAWSRSLQHKSPLNLSTVPDITGKEFNRYSVTGEFDDLMKGLTAEVTRSKLSEEEFVGRYLKGHVDRGLELLAADLQREGNLDAFWSVLLDTIPRTTNPTAVAAAGSVLPINLLVGEELGSGQPVVCRLNQETNPHMAVIGIPGSGKTQFVMKLLADLRTNYKDVNFIFLDYAKGDVASNSHFVEVTGAHVVKLPEKKLPINPFLLDKYDSPSIRFAAEEKVESLHSYQPLGAVQKGLLARSIETAYERRLHDDQPYPDFDQVYQVLLDIYAEEDRKEDTLTETLRKLTSFQLFPTVKESERLFDSLLDRTLIIDLHTLPALRELVAFCLIERLYRELKVAGDSAVDSSSKARQLRTILVIDEAHNYLPRNNIFLEKLIREMRSMGLGVILLSQSPDDFDQKRFDYSELLEFVYVLKCTTNRPQHIQKLIRCKSETAKLLAPRLANLAYPECYTQGRGSSSDYLHMTAKQFHIAYK